MVAKSKPAHDGHLPFLTRPDRPPWVAVTGGPRLLDAMATELDELHASAGTPITARRRWLSLWLQAFHSWQPWAVAVRDEHGGRLDGVALLAWKQRRGVTEIIALGAGPSDYIRLPARSLEAAGRLAEQIVAEISSVRGRWRLQLPDVPAGDAVVARMAADLPYTRLGAGDSSPATVFGEDRSVNAYTSRNLRSHARGKRRQLAEAAGSADIQFTTDPAAIAELQPRLEAIRLARDIARGRLGDIDTDEGSAFWWAALPALAAAGELEVATLWAGEDVAAYSVALIDGSAYRSWDPRMNPGWAKYSPGLALDFALMERVLGDERFDVFDRMRGEEAYKLRTANVVVPSETFTAWSSATLRALEVGVDELKQRVRRSTRLTSALRMARRRLRGRVPAGSPTEDAGDA